MDQYLEALSLSGIGAGYGKERVLRNLSLSVKKGECLAILGENGAGKTTLFRAILYLLPNMAGTLRILGRTIEVHHPQLQRGQIRHAIGGEGIGHFYCIDATKRGDITSTGKVWHLGGEDFHRSMSTCAVKDGLCYAADLSGFLYCIDAKTGKTLWTHDTFAAIWGSPYVVDGKVLLGTESGEVFVLQHGRELKLLGTMDMNNSVYTTPVAANGVLYINNRNTLFAIGGK